MNSEAIVEDAPGGTGMTAITTGIALSRSPGSPSPPVTLPELDLVRAAVMAPSPDNNQPWYFRFDAGKLLVYEDRARRLPSDVCSMFSLLGLGAAVENVAVEASRHGLSVEVTCFTKDQLKPLRLPQGEGSPNHRRARVNDCGEEENQISSDAPVAEISFSVGAQADQLVRVLGARCTNRHPYSSQPISAEALNQMLAATARFGDCGVTWSTDRPAIRRLSKLVAIADRVRFERAEFHAELYRQLRLTPAEAERTRDGLDLRTLGLPPGGDLLLRSLRSWPLVRTLNRVGLSRMLTLPSAALVCKSGAVGVLTVGAPTSASFFDAGRAFERLWLTATALDLSLHPLGSLPIFVGHHELLAGRALDRRHARLAASLSQDLRDLLPAISGQTPVMIFRLGTSTAKLMRSLRRPVEEVLTWNGDPTFSREHGHDC